MTHVYDFELKTIDGHPKKLADLAGNALLIVNVASQCGYTPQYKGLEELQRRYEGRGLRVLGFPCNDFGAQEPGTESEIKAFCETSFGVTFPMFAKVSVKGAGQTPLYAYLTKQPTQPDGPGDVAWNFAKFLVDAEGKVVARFKPGTDPLAPELTQAIETALPQR